MGSNLGNREENLSTARELIGTKVGDICSISSIYETAAWGITAQNAFLNQVVALETRYSPSAVLAMVLKIEQEMGRIREIKWGERSIDIDILYYNAEIISTENLTIPHPFIEARKFVLIPLCDVAGDLVHPKHKLSNFDLLKQCPDLGKVRLYC